MHVEPTTDTVKNPPEQFLGDVWVDTIATPHDGDQRMVEFHGPTRGASGDDADHH